MARKLKEFNTLAPALDARLGHGYGRAGKPSGAGTTWQKGADFPYVDELETTEEDEEEMEDFMGSPESASKFMSKLPTSYYATHDQYGQRRARVDRGSIASGRGLGENAPGISPIPNLYKNRGAAVGGTSPTVYKTGPGHKGGGHGSTRGFFGPPPPMLSDTGEPAYSLNDILSDDERALARAAHAIEIAHMLADEYDNLFFDQGREDEV